MSQPIRTEPDVFKTPTATELAALWRRTRTTEDSPMAAEPITVNRALIWAVGILGFIGSTAACAGVAALWSQGQSLTRLDAKMEYLSNQVQSSSADRYTGTAAATDRAAMLQTFNTTREAWAASWKALVDVNTEQDRRLDDLRGRVTRIETIVEGRKP